MPRTTAANGKLRMRDGATAVRSTPTADTALFLCADNWDGSDRGIKFTAGGGDNYTFINSTTVVFIETSTNSCKSFIDHRVFLDIEALLVVGPNNNFRFGGSYSAFNATIPLNANLEYQQNSPFGGSASQTAFAQHTAASAAFSVAL